ncbi:hypothetical protein IV36_GL002176 [Liquorilactobacillus mali]|uniref:Uncharacterized protein n=2 Tax=Liquorilactobacillus mali TaxID=1618 RepID=A0A0R2FPG5_9LACO|nr:hypothetical protein IV36_GL002176 [Liquorilactobacillus mali]
MAHSQLDKDGEVMKQSLNEFLTTGLANLGFDGGLDLLWDKDGHTFTVDITFSIEQKGQHFLLDMTGDSSKENPIEFVDTILIYDGTKQNFKPAWSDDFLACIAYNGKSGWERARGVAFLEYLKVILLSGRENLQHFLSNSDQLDFLLNFELKWSEETFEQLVREKQKSISGTLPYEV